METKTNYQVLTGLELANLTLELLDKQANFYLGKRTMTDIEKARAIAACKTAEMRVYETAKQLIERPGETGVFAFSVKRMIEAQKEYYKSSGAMTSKTDRQRLLNKCKNLEAGVREDGQKIINAAILVNEALRAGGRVVQVSGDDNAPVHTERRGEWKQNGF